MVPFDFNLFPPYAVPELWDFVHENNKKKNNPTFSIIKLVFTDWL